MDVRSILILARWRHDEEDRLITSPLPDPMVSSESIGESQLKNRIILKWEEGALFCECPLQVIWAELRCGYGTSEQLK